MTDPTSYAAAIEAAARVADDEAKSALGIWGSRSPSEIAQKLRHVAAAIRALAPERGGGSEPASPAAPSGWRDIASAPKDGTRFWGRVDDDAIAMLWHEGFEAFVSSWRRMEMAAGYAINGKDYEDHHPVTHQPTAWMPLPAPRAAAPPPPVPVQWLEPERHMDECDAAHVGEMWLADIGPTLPSDRPYSVTRSQVNNDGKATIIWAPGRIMAAYFLLRDEANWTFLLRYGPPPVPAQAESGSGSFNYEKECRRLLGVITERGKQLCERDNRIRELEGEVALERKRADDLNAKVFAYEAKARGERQ